ncbi:Zn-dependent hydrolase [Pistricoccus aurantiacus]|uniref:Zn-dependent hydrolase n=1 Tax=Pistricoccus aurantiacus TaxID=1883414 RepID=A0A5B8SN00_9GAMM|nr:Zn-dependent hydrolase [Pistricoccus aurantiacus]QEA37621.1 Zn-dependent hydrolase [Pistricoccus aurantiacus]
MTEKLRINQDRLWQRLMRMAEIGATPAGGSCRVALTEEDRQGRDLFIEWCRTLGCEIRIDRMGNIFAQRPGTDPQRLPIACGSHLDTQPHGGKFDGVYGVLAGVEIFETLNDQGIETAAPLEICVWTNEEGARFAPPMISSGVFGGTYELDYGLSRQDADGITLGEALESIGYAGTLPCGGHRLGAFLEAHIEQGPVLERQAETIGVVTGVQGSRWYRVTFHGQDAHTGSTPMAGRRDALVSAAHAIQAVRDIAEQQAPSAVATVGRIDCSPNSHNTIPGEVALTVDMRHATIDTLDIMETQLHKAVNVAAQQEGTDIEIQRIMATPPVHFDARCIEAVAEAASKLGYPHRRMLSGAGHDACHVARVAPTSMIFVPCAGGLSHNEAESATPEDLAAGANVLLHALLELAQ